MDRAIQTGSLGEEFAGHYEHQLIEEIQDRTAKLLDEPLFPDWRSTKDFASTGEHFYVLGSPSDKGPGSDVGDDAIPEVEGQWANLPPSLRWLAKAENTHRPVMRVSTPAEKRLFKKKVADFQSGAHKDGVDIGAFNVWCAGNACMDAC